MITGSGYHGALAELDPDIVDAVRKHYLDSLRAEGVTELDATTLVGVGTTSACS